MRRFALSFLLLAAGASAHASAAERVRAPVPWKAGETVVYESEVFTRELFEGAPSVSRTTDRTEVRVEAQGRDGYALSWATRDSRIEAVDGDRTMADLIAPFLDQLDELEVVVEVDRDGRYRRVRDLDGLATRLRRLLVPYFAAGFERTIANADPKQSKFDRDAALAYAREHLAQNIEQLVTLESVEAIASEQTRTFGAFAGLSMTPDRRYRDDAPLISPEQGIVLPAKREYVLSLDRDDPNLARIRWTHELDADGDARALWRLAEEFGEAETDAPRTGRPKGLSLREEGVLVFRRDTGAIHMLQVVTTSRYGREHDTRSRHRMRLHGTDRTWAQEEGAAAR